MLAFCLRLEESFTGNSSPKIGHGATMSGVTQQGFACDRCGFQNEKVFIWQQSLIYNPWLIPIIIHPNQTEKAITDLILWRQMRDLKGLIWNQLDPHSTVIKNLFSWGSYGGSSGRASEHGTERQGFTSSWNYGFLASVSGNWLSQVFSAWNWVKF